MAGRRPMFGQEAPQKRLGPRESFIAACKHRHRTLRKMKKESANTDVIKQALWKPITLPKLENTKSYTNRNSSNTIKPRKVGYRRYP